MTPPAARITITEEQNERREYWASVKSLAEEFVKEAEDENDIDDLIREAVNGSQYVIYTNKNISVIRFSSNGDAAWESGNGVDGTKSESEALQRMAYYAMAADVGEAVAELVEEEEDDE